MSAGAIPVVYSNDWLPLFASPTDPDRVVNWTQCALFVKAGKGSERTLDVIHGLTEAEVCTMKKCSLSFWGEFGSSRGGWLKGMLLWVNNERMEGGSD